MFNFITPGHRADPEDLDENEELFWGWIYLEPFAHYVLSYSDAFEFDEMEDVMTHVKFTPIGKLEEIFGEQTFILDGEDDRVEAYRHISETLPFTCSVEDAPFTRFLTAQEFLEHFDFTQQATMPTFEIPIIEFASNDMRLESKFSVYLGDGDEVNNSVDILFDFFLDDIKLNQQLNITLFFPEEEGDSHVISIDAFKIDEGANMATTFDIFAIFANIHSLWRLNDIREKLGRNYRENQYLKIAYNGLGKKNAFSQAMSLSKTGQQQIQKRQRSE